MAQFLKFPESVGLFANPGQPQVVNADKIIAVYQVGPSQLRLVTTNTINDADSENSIEVSITPNTEENVKACIAGINKALTSNPGGRVVALSPDPAYNISRIQVETGQ